MSRLGKKPIEIPEKTTVVKDGQFIRVNGPLGKNDRSFRDDINIEINNKEITLTPKRNSKLAKALWGTYTSHIRNMIAGVNAPFEKKLIVDGVGYKYEASGDRVILSLGFSHKVEVKIPENIKVVIEKNEMKISGINKEQVGAFAAQIRNYKKPEPYKGKGIRYSNEIIRRKQGKKAS